MDAKLAVFHSSRENHIVIRSIAIELDFADVARMYFAHCFYRLTGVDIPDGHGTAAVAGDYQAVLPIEFNHCIFVSIEKALRAL